MDENETIIDYSRKKLRKVPQEVLLRGRVLEELYLDSNSIEILPKGVFNLSNLRILSVSDNNLSKLSTYIGNLECLEKLDISKNCIASFPDSIVKCTQLAQLDGSVNSIVKLSDGLISLSSLTHLVLNETFLECLPEHFGRLSGLKVLELRHNHLNTLPKSICNLKELERLDIGENEFLHLPVAIGHLTSLQELLADGNIIEEIPPVIGLLRNLVFLELSKNKLESLPPEMEELINLTDLYLSANELLELPENIGSLSSLQTLKLDENDLIFLPSSIGRLHSLEELDVTTNNLEGLPCTVGQLTMLRVLNLDNNCIKSLPAELGDCISLSLLSLHSNELITIPETLGSLQNLQMIKLSGNMLNYLPLSFLVLKNLKALWLSENQSKPVVPLHRKYNEEERKFVLSCFLLPQQSWDQDEIQQQDRVNGDVTSISSLSEDKDDIDGKGSVVVRTRGSISESLISGNKKDEEETEGELKPWYEQEFIESADNSDSFPDHEELNEKNLSTEGSYDLNRESIALEESFQSRFLFKNDIPSSMSLLSNITSPPCISSYYKDQSINVTSFESNGTDTAVFSLPKGPSPSPLSPTSQAVSLETGAVGLSRGLSYHNEKKSLAHALRDINDDSVCGNTSSLAQPNKREAGNSYIDHSIELAEPKDDNMRLRFNNKRQRNGNAICQYEAFKPTRFNLYQESNGVSWSAAAVANDVPDASPMLKKKSLKDNPLIGSRLARDELPRPRRGDYATNQKFEEKIKVLQQQRLKERSRRRDYSARVEYCGEQRQISQLSPASPPPYMETHSDQNMLPNQPPPNDFLISDEGDSVAIKLGDFVLVSPKEAEGTRTNSPAEIRKTADTPFGRVQQDESSPPVESNRFNGFAEQKQQHYPASHFDPVEKRSHFAKDNGVLQASVLPDEGRQSTLYANVAVSSTSELKVVDEGAGEKRRNGSHHNPNNITDNEQKGNHSRNRSNHSILLENYGTSDQERKRADNAGNSSNYSTSQTHDQNIGKKACENRSVASQSPSGPRPNGGRRILPAPASVQHVTVKSSKIDQPLSPTLVMAVDGRNGKQDVTFKEFLPSCAVEDVTSFLVNNLSNVSSKKNNRETFNGEYNTFKTDSARSDQNKDSSVQFIQENVSVDCDVEEVTRNISQHLAKFSKPQNVESGKRMRVQVTDLDMPDAACPISRNFQHDKKFEESAVNQGKNVQVITVPTGQIEEVHQEIKTTELVSLAYKYLGSVVQKVNVRVYRSPILGFSIGGGVETETNVAQGIYVVDVKADGPSSHLLKPGDRLLEVNKLNLRNVSHEHAVLFLTHNQQLDLLIERAINQAGKM